MRQYRIVTALRKDGTEHFEVQVKWWFGIWGSKYPVYYDSREYFYTQKAAESYLHKLVAKDEIQRAIKKRHKEFKSKVVYGPYPP